MSARTHRRLGHGRAELRPHRQHAFHLLYNIATPITLAGTTLISGDGNATFLISGAISGSGGIIKTGASPLRINGTTSYLRTTTVNGGTLSLGQVNSNNQSSTVSIAASAGAKLDLAFRGTDTVGKLFINGIQQPAGNYTSAHASGAFTGGVTLHVTTGGNP